MNLLYKLTITALCFSLMGILNSCIYEDEVVCPCEVRFVYDYNMEFADAFPSQVNDVTLLSSTLKDGSSFHAETAATIWTLTTECHLNFRPDITGLSYGQDLTKTIPESL